MERIRRPGSLAAEDDERAKTWLATIAAVLLPNPECQQEGDECRYKHAGGLSINMKGRGWYDHAAERGSTGAIALVMHLKGCVHKDAVQWLVAFLAAHPGTGTCGVVDDGADDDEADPASAADCRDILDRCKEDLTGTPSEAYLRSRALPGPYPAGLLGHLDDARIGEGALVAKLTGNGRLTGVQLTYLTPSGRKSLIKPVRRRFNLEKSPGSTFYIAAPDPAAALDAVFDYLTAEGAEDALSLRALKRNLTILGTPGVNTVKHLDLLKGARIAIVKDGDEPDSEPAKALTAGIDALLLGGAKVRVSETPAPDANGKFDANRILQDQGLGALRDLVARAPEAMLSFHGRIIRLSTITDPEAFAKERRAVSKITGVSVKVIDEEINKLRPPRVVPGTLPVDDDAPGGYEGAADPEWEGDADLAAALNSAVTIMPRFLKAPAYIYDTIALWAAMTYLVQSEEIDLPIAPQLGFESLVEGSGKSVAAEIVATLSYRGYLRSGYTASTLFRRINQEFVTPCLSEYHNILSERDKGLLSVVNACHRRSEAWIDRTETDAQTGARYVASYKCWTALSWGAIGAVPREAQSRSIILPMQAALPDESRALDHTRPLQHKGLIDVRRQFAKWSSTIKALPTPTMPKSLYNRAADNFRPLFAIAELAGGDWPKRIKDAAEAIGKVEHRPSLQVRLLTGIRDAFKAADVDKIPTANLIDALCEEKEDGWQEAHNHKRINEYWLRENLRGLIDPKGSQEWQEGGGSDRKHIRGYELRQFNDAFLRYLYTSSVAPHASGTSGTSGTEPKNPKETAKYPDPDTDPDTYPDPGHPGQHPGHEKPRKSAAERPSVPDVPDVPDAGTPPSREKDIGVSPNEPDGSSPPEPPAAVITTDFQGDTPVFITPELPSFSSNKPNGASPESKSPRSSWIKEAVQKTARQHPDWSLAQIGEHYGRTESEVRRLLGSGERA